MLQELSDTVADILPGFTTFKTVPKPPARRIGFIYVVDFSSGRYDTEQIISQIMGRNTNIRRLVVDATFWLDGRKKYVNVFKTSFPFIIQ
jgi:hypothetical protein